MKKTALFLSLIMVFSLLTPFGAYAKYTDTVEAFKYEGYSIPAYDGDIYEVINGNNPKFTDLNQTIYESYAPLDSLGRVGVCEANIDYTLMPTGERGDISSVKPTGWIQKKYDFISGKYLYNRSHIIGWQLTGENANKKNLMTGTRTFNATGMLEFENKVASYVKKNNANNVLYRVTPVFQGDNLLASGVIMEGESVDDNGKSVKFCVFVYNVEKNVKIDYETGDSLEAGTLVDISKAYIRLKSLKYTYTGKAIKPLEYVTLDEKTLVEGRDYLVNYSNNKEIGTATVTIIGIGEYEGFCSKKFTIAKPVPKDAYLSKVKKGKGFFKASWKKVKGVSGYQLQYSTKSSFKGAKKTTVNKASAVSKTVKGLKKKKYYVRIRTYKTVNNKKFYSKWSKYKTVKVK